MITQTLARGTNVASHSIARIGIAVLLLGHLSMPATGQAPPNTAPASTTTTKTQVISVADYPNIQAAIDANPGKTIFVPPGDYALDRTLNIAADFTALEGSGRLIQHNAADSIIRVSSADFVRVSGLTLTRPEGKLETTQEGITVRESRFVELDGLRIIDNRGPAGSIRVMDSTDCSVRNCLVYNYMLVTIEDRTASSLYGFGFNAIDGTGIVVVESPGILLANNRVIEENLLATPEVRTQYDLGHIVKRNAVPGTAMPPDQWKQEYVQSNWHQGSGIYVGGSSGRVIGNQVRNAAQGMDIHSDQIIIANNVVENSHMGMKAMHGARNVLITGNQFIAPSLWGICLSTGTSSHEAQAANGDQPAREANLDGGSIISNNIISDFGYGRAAWNWNTHGQRAPIVLAWGEGPQLKDVLVQGNVVYDTGRDGILVDGAVQVAPPRYVQAIIVTGTNPTGLHFSNNILPPGIDGVSNIELPQ